MAAKPLMTWDPKYWRWYKRYKKVPIPYILP